MFTPGAVMSGLRISGVTLFGPWEENAAMNGAGFVPSFADGVVMYPSGSLWEEK